MLRHCCFIVALLLLGTTAQASYREHPAAQSLIDELAAEGIDPVWVGQMLAQAERSPEVLAAIARPAEKSKSWGEYRRIFLTESRIEDGVAFWQEHAEALARAEQQYGVPAAQIIAILGVETRYGRYRGRHRVLDALATLAFDYPPRSPFFRGELQALFQLAQQQQLSLETLMGSYAGAIGYAQFIPSSYNHYAVDFDGDGRVDLYNSPVDAIGSIANYLARHGWRTGEPVAARVADAANLGKYAGSSPKPETALGQWRRLGAEIPAWQPLPAETEAALLVFDGEQGDEYWLGLKNFYVITRYNHSPLYALACFQLAEAIAQARGVE